MKIKQNYFLKVFIILSWISMWISINSMPGELLYMSKNIVTFINGTRTINAFIFSLVTIIIAFYYFSKNKSNERTISIVLVFFLIHFVSQIIGLILNPERSIFDLNNVYLVLYSLGTLSILYLIKNLNLNELIPYLMYFIFLILIFLVIFILYNNKDLIPDVVNQKNLYYLISPEVSVNYQAQPRITGLSRTVSIINIFFIAQYLTIYKKKYSYIYLFFIFILSNIIWLAQSRGTIICFYTSSLILIFFLNNLTIKRKIFVFSVITIFSILTSNILINIKTPNDIEVLNKKDIKIKLENKKDSKIQSENKNNQITDSNEIDFSNILDLSNSRFITQKNTSGRITLWKQSVASFDKKVIFGYGPQADRIVLFNKKNKYGNNVSNGSLYALLSGGYPSLISIIIIYVYVFYLFIELFKKRKNIILRPENKFYIISMTFCIFFMIRSLIENSFTLFSIDFLITILSMFIIERFRDNNKRV